MNAEAISILSPSLNDARVAAGVLREYGFDAMESKNGRELCAVIRAGGCGAVLITDEALSPSVLLELEIVLDEQETWSDLPILLLTTHERARQNEVLLKNLNVSLLERPFSKQTLVRSVEAALKARKKQYQVRDLLAEITKSKDEADRANLTKTQFLANMSHEIRTPIGAIIGFSDLIQRSEIDEPERLRYMEIISRNSHQLLRLIDDILDLSKVEAGKLLIEDVEFRLPDVIADLTSIMRFRAAEKGVDFKVDLRSSIPDLIYSDPVRLRQILSNILGNAIKFTSAGFVQLLVSYADPVLKFVIRDTGPGLTADQAAHLFRPFVQADPSTTRKFGGSGLGLVISRQLAIALGGNVELTKSADGQGSEFAVTLKIRTTSETKLVKKDALTIQTSAQNSKDAVKSLDHLKVLLVEDSPDNRVLITRYLEKTGCLVTTAGDGAEGVIKALEDEVDIVLMDIQMPNMDGHEATRQLRRAGYVKPIIALTAHAMKEEKLKGLNSGFNEFLTKPIQPKVLIEILSRYH